MSAGDSKIATGHLLQEVEYPDSASASDVVTYAYNAQSERIYTKDQAGNVILVDFDDGGRVEHRRITTLTAGFDGAVRRISTSYTDLGQVELVTQWDNATAGSGSVVDEVKFTYDYWGNVGKFEQDLNSAVGAGGSVDDYQVSYSYEKATSGRNTIRRTGSTLPSGNAITYTYSSGGNLHDDEASRVSDLKDGATRMVKYFYNGAGQVVGTLHQVPDVQWELYDGAGAYPDLDRFDRVVQSRWTKDLATDVDFYSLDITYDRNSNITLIEDNVFTGFDVAYTNDDLDRLTRAQEGTWGGSSIGSETRDQEWTLSHTGNWDNAKLDLDGDGNQTDPGEYDDTRTHNDVNELTARDVDTDSSDDYTHSYDAVGNMTDDGEAYKFEYDAFGRLRYVKNQSNALVSEYVYNGLGFLVSEHADTDDDMDVDGDDKWYHNVYDERWRKLATYREDDSDPKEEFLPHQAGNGGFGGSSYINALVCRWKDANTAWTSASDGTLEETVYYCQNWRGDVSVLISNSGAMLEWAKYSAYGVPFGLPGGDTDSDGDCDSTDVTQIQTWIDAPAYDVRGDIDLDGDVDATDKSTVQGSYEGTTTGWEVLSAIGNRAGYAGYMLDGNGLWHVRYRVLDSGLGRWLRRDPLTYADSTSLCDYSESQPATKLDPRGTTSCTVACKAYAEKKGSMLKKESGVLCADDGKGGLKKCVCIWWSHPDEQINDAIHYCLQEHEEQHIADGSVCREAGEEAVGEGGPGGAANEVIHNIHAADCLAQIDCGSMAHPELCASVVDWAYDHIEDVIRDDWPKIWGTSTVPPPPIIDRPVNMPPAPPQPCSVVCPGVDLHPTSTHEHR